MITGTLNISKSVAVSSKSNPSSSVSKNMRFGDSSSIFLKISVFSDADPTYL